MRLTGVKTIIPKTHQHRFARRGRSTITNALGDHVYTLPPDYTANNAVWVAVDPDISSATITLATPTRAEVLSLLASAGNGPVNNILAITHHTITRAGVSGFPKPSGPRPSPPPSRVRLDGSKKDRLAAKAANA